MARLTENKIVKALDVAVLWKERCLLRDGSIFTDGEIWTSNNIDQLHRYFVENFKEGKEDFLTKLSSQLKDSPSEIPQLAAEMLSILFLFPDQITGETKKEQILKVWSWSGSKLDETSQTLRSFTDAGIGHSGTAFQTLKYLELTFFIKAMQQWKGLLQDERETLLNHPWEFGLWVNSIESGVNRQFRHIWVYLLFPDSYERIASTRHKQLILKFFHSYLDDYSPDPKIPDATRTADDHRIFHIRKRLEQEHPGQEVDFYKSPLRELWNSEKDNIESKDKNKQKKQKDLKESYVSEEIKLWGKNNWIFQANPDLYDIDAALKSLRKMTWSVSQHTKEIKTGDKVYIWRSGEEAGIIALATVISEPDLLEGDSSELQFAIDAEKFSGKNMAVYIQIEKILPTVLERTSLRSVPQLRNLSILRAPQGTNFLVTRDEARIIDAYLQRMGVTATSFPIESRYTAADFATESNIPVDIINKWFIRLQRKKQIVLQGPPGTGKTFIAERLARMLVSETEGFIQTIQFHPSYAYEDFMQGIRPEINNGQLTFTTQPGRFLEFCDQVQNRNGSPCVLIIDELNRANLSRVFGELMYLLEYRDKMIPLAGNANGFRVPQNVFLVGTMNTADRSIALVDHALRRRFSFIYIGPNYDVLRDYLSQHDLPSEGLIKALRQVNASINDRNYEVGISFFLSDGKNLKETLPLIWEGEIEPYLEEYFFDQIEKVDELRWQKLSQTVLKEWA